MKPETIRWLEMMHNGLSMVRDRADADEGFLAVLDALATHHALAGEDPAGLVAEVKAVRACTVAEHLMSTYERVLLRRAEKAERERDDARTDAKVQNKACAEEMLKRQHMQANWDTMVASVKQHYEAQLNAEASNRRLMRAFSLARPYFEVLLAQADNEDTDVKGIVQELFAAVEDAS